MGEYTPAEQQRLIPLLGRTGGIGTPDTFRPA
jgi:hypothetical protein